MEKINLHTNSRQIQNAYDNVLRGDPDTVYVVYTVVNSVLEVTTTGGGDLAEFTESFDDGKIQFGLVRVTVPGSDVSKVAIVGWCPDNAPVKSRMSFAANFAEVSKVLSRVHVQITARDQDDLSVDEIVSRVGAAAGARYSIQTSLGSSSKAPAPRPKTAPQAQAAAPLFVPKSTGKPVAKPTSKPSFVPTSTCKPIAAPQDDEWGGEKEIEERDFAQKPLEDVPSAYKPTKVNIDELRKQKSDTVSSTPKPSLKNEPQPKPAPVSLSDKLDAYKANEEDGRLTALPKPKVNNAVASRFAPSTGSASFGSKPSVNVAPKREVVGGASRDFAAQGGKTPAQLWAEKRGQYKSVSPEAEEAKPEPEPEQESEPEVESVTDKLAAAKVEDEKEEIPLPTRNLPPPPARQETPPVRNLPPAPKEASPEPTPSLPARTLPPAPATSSTPARNLPPPPVREERSLPPAPEAKAGKKAIADYDYEKDEDNEIAFAEGDLIVEIDFVDEEWWSGKHSKSGEVGLFPSTYVTLVEEEPVQKEEEPVQAPEAVAEPEQPPSGKSAVAEYDYEKDEDNEISFAEGDLIVEIEFVDDDWWSGKHAKSGETGLFPANYVTLK